MSNKQNRKVVQLEQRLVCTNNIKFNNNLPILLNKLKVKKRTNGGALYLGII
jgi:hypothetical protein